MLFIMFMLRKSLKALIKSKMRANFDEELSPRAISKKILVICKILKQKQQDFGENASWILFQKYL